MIEYLVAQLEDTYRNGESILEEAEVTVPRLNSEQLKTYAQHYSALLKSNAENDLKKGKRNSIIDSVMRNLISIDEAAQHATDTLFKIILKERKSFGSSNSGTKIDYAQRLRASYRSGQSIEDAAGRAVSKLTDKSSIQDYFEVYKGIMVHMITSYMKKEYIDLKKDYECRINPSLVDAVKAVEEGISIPDVAEEVTKNVINALLEDDKESSGTWQTALPLLKDVA